MHLPDVDLRSYHTLMSTCNLAQISETVDLLLKLAASPIVPCPSAANASPSAVAHALGYALIQLIFHRFFAFKFFICSYKQLASALVEASASFGCKWSDVMISAVEINDTEALCRALALIGNVNMLHSNGCTAMHRAIACNSLGALSALLAAGADCTIKDSNGYSSFMLAALQPEPAALKIIIDGIETSVFCSLMHLRPIGLFLSLESSCQTVAEKLLGMFETSRTSGVVKVRPSALSLLVWRLPAAAVMGLDNDSLSHFTVLCCFTGCEHSAKSIISRRPSILSCIHSHGLNLLHIAVLTASHNVVQHALLVSSGLVNSLSSKPPSPLKGKPLRPSELIIAASHCFQAEWTRLFTWRAWVLRVKTSASSADFCLLEATLICAIQRGASHATCCCGL
jgi:hypothetical protein